MSQLMLMFDQKLTKFDISRQRYDKEALSLLQAGFTQEQADKLIIRSSSRNAVRAVLINCSNLLASPYGLNQAQIVRIAGHAGGSKNIKAVKSAFKQLQLLGFTDEQIVRIAGHTGGSKNIKAVKFASKNYRI